MPKSSNDSVWWELAWAQSHMSGHLCAHPAALDIANAKQARAWLASAPEPVWARARSTLKHIPAGPVPDGVILRGSREVEPVVWGMDEAPFALFVRGEKRLLASGTRVAIVGSRNPDSSARDVARVIARELASAGVTIVSGLAIGVDGIAHAGALDARGHTIAVLGSGLDHVHPASHDGLARRIVAADGALVSEYAPHVRGRRDRFPARNRIIAALSHAVIVIQAAHGSGSLHTTRFARDLNVPIGVVPAAFGARRWAGGNMLLEDDGITAISSIDAAFRLIGLAAPVRSDDVPSGPRSLIELAHQWRIDAAAALERAALLEAEGQLVRLGDGRYVAGAAGV